MEEESVQQDSQHQSVNESSIKPQPKVQGTIVTANGRQITSKLNPDAKAFYPAYLQRKMYREAFSLALKNDHHQHVNTTKIMTMTTTSISLTTSAAAAAPDANGCTTMCSTMSPEFKECNKSNTKSTCEREAVINVAAECARENHELSRIGDQSSADKAIKRHDDNQAGKDVEKIEEKQQQQREAPIVDIKAESNVEETMKAVESEIGKQEEKVKEENVKEDEKELIVEKKKNEVEMAAVPEQRSNEETPEPPQEQNAPPSNEKNSQPQEEHQQEREKSTDLRQNELEEMLDAPAIPHTEECAEPIQPPSVTVTHIENGHVGDDASEPIQTQMDADIKDEAALFSDEIVNEAAGDLSNANKGEPQQKAALHAVVTKKSTSLMCSKVKTALRTPTPKRKSPLDDEKKKSDSKHSSMTRKIANFSLGLCRKSNTGPIGETATVKRNTTSNMPRAKKLSETLQNISTSLKSKPIATRMTSSTSTNSATTRPTIEHSQSFLSKSTIRLNGAVHKQHSSKDAVSMKSNSSTEHSITSRSTSTHGKAPALTSPLAKTKDPITPTKTLPRGTVASTLRQSEAKKVNH